MIKVPEEGRPEEDIDAVEELLQTDNHSSSIMGKVRELLQEAGASRDYIRAYQMEAMSGDYNNLIVASLAYLNPEEYENEHS